MTVAAGRPRARCPFPLLPALVVAAVALAAQSSAAVEALRATVHSDPGPDKTYANGDTIEVRVTFRRYRLRRA